MLAVLESKWELKRQPAGDGDVPSFFSESFGLLPAISHLLLARGIDREDKVRDFLHPHLQLLHSPLLFADMNKAVTRIRAAIAAGERICVYGDYDADGVSSTSLIMTLFKQLQANVEFYIPHRVHEGYGLNDSAIRALAERKTTLIVTVDTGISAVSQIDLANQLGIDVIVTDHHEAPMQLPAAYAIINPKLPTCQYPFKGLAGVGVALKLTQALLGAVPDWALQYATVGTIADMMPMTDENRVIVKLGLQAMIKNPLPAFKVFHQHIVGNRQLKADDIGFQLAPRINASGRLESAEPAVHFLTATDTGQAELHLERLEQLNLERRDLVKQMTAEAFAIVERDQLTEDHVMIVAKEGWNAGVVGIVAAKLVETYARTTIVLRIDESTGLAKGSARSHNGLDLMVGLRSMEHLFEHYGGHQGAAGMTLHRDFIEDFRIKMNDYAHTQQTSEQLVPIHHVDLQLALRDIDLPFVEQLALLEPFGPGNSEPIFEFTQVQVERVELIGKKQEHAKVVCSDSQQVGDEIEMMAFQKPQLARQLMASDQLQVLSRLTINEFRGRRKPQLMLIDWRLASMQLRDWRQLVKKVALEKLLQPLMVEQDVSSVAILVAHKLDYQELCDRLNIHPLPAGYCFDEQGRIQAIGESINDDRHIRTCIALNLPVDPDATFAACQRMFNLQQLVCVFQPTRASNRLTLPEFSQFARLYRWLQTQAEGLHKSDERWLVCMKANELNGAQVRLIVDVFCELGLMAWDGQTLVLRVNDDHKKLSLSSSARVQQLADAEQRQQFLQQCNSFELKTYMQQWQSPQMEGMR